jgi:hypothetical protein
MYIHAGNRRIISDKKIVGIFNVETLRLSKDNKTFLSEISPEDKTVLIDRENKFFSSKVRSYTIIKRTAFDCDFIWRKKND